MDTPPHPPKGGGDVQCPNPLLKRVILLRYIRRRPTVDGRNRPATRGYKLADHTSNQSQLISFAISQNTSNTFKQGRGFGPPAVGIKAVVLG